MKKVFIALICLLAICSNAYSAEKATGQTNIGMSAINVDGQSVAVLTLYPTIGVGNWKVGLDVNIYLPASQKPKNMPYVMFRYVEYDDGTSGIRYGILNGITLGYGLIMNDYSSQVNGSTMFDPTQAGIRAYSNAYAPYGVMAMITHSQIYAGRITYQADNVRLLDRPIRFGISYAVDNDGIKTKTKTYGKGQSGMSADAGWLLLGDAGTLFAEAGQLTNYSSGAMVGLKGNIFGFMTYQFDYRSMGKNFIPGYFGYQYEVAAYDLASVNIGAVSGYHGGLGFALGSLAIFNLEYQNMLSDKKSNPSLKAELTTQEIANVSVKARYEQLQMKSLNAAGADGANIVVDATVPLAMVGIPLPGKTNVSWKRMYTSDGTSSKFIDSMGLGYQYSLPF